MSDKTKEIAIAFSILIFGLVTLFYLIPTQVKVAENLEIKSLSPAFFPELAALLILFLSGVLIVTWFIHRTDRDDSDGSREPSRSEMTAREEFRVLGAASRRTAVPAPPPQPHMAQNLLHHRRVGYERNDVPRQNSFGAAVI